LVQYTKTGKIYQIITKYTKWPKYISNGRKIDHMSKNIPKSFIARPSKIYPNCDFWSETIPSGNPDIKLILDNSIAMTSWNPRKPKTLAGLDPGTSVPEVDAMSTAPQQGVNL
jgi:hypothetical protein